MTKKEKKDEFYKKTKKNFLFSLFAVGETARLPIWFDPPIDPPFFDRLFWQIVFDYSTIYIYRGVKWTSATFLQFFGVLARHLSPSLYEKKVV